SISGIALLSTSTSHQVAASVSISSQTSDASSSLTALSVAQGDECSFMNAFKEKESHADVGILKCGVYEICVEDANSSVGGRCMALTDYKTCTFANGTAGVQCEGYLASAFIYVDTSLIGCGWSFCMRWIEGRHYSWRKQLRRRSCM
ncbi:hypothetical protein ACHAWX_000042, partial [Stephanocyclus meneghinianus]